MIRISVVILAFALLATPAEAGPVASAIGMVTSWVGKVIAAGGAGAFFLRVGASVALSMLSMALGQRKMQTPGIKTETTTSGGTTPQRFILGLSATGGQLIAPPSSFGNPGHTPRGQLVYVIALSVVPGCTLLRTIVDDEAFSGGTPDPDGWGFNVTDRRKGNILISYQDGSQTAAHPGLLARFGSDPDRPWFADMVGPGTCYVVARFGYAREHFNGLPQCRFEVLGIPVYDPRADSTVGGSGPQRWSDPSTWTQSTNNAVLIYNVMRGIDIGAGLRWGGECTAEDLPLDNWFAAMNACDVGIDDGNGGTVPQYRGGIEVALDDEPAAIIEELLKGACAQMSEIGGVWKIRVGGPAMPTYFLTDDDVLVSQEQEFDPFPSLSDTYNGISCAYPDPESLWESKEAPPRYNPVWEAEDGGRRLVADLRLPACPYPEQVQRVMTASIADHRRMRQHRMVLAPEAAVLEPLDTLGWTSERYGYAAKVFEVSRVTDFLMTLNQGLHLRERDSGDFDWVPGDLIPVAPVTVITTPPEVQVVPGFTVSASVVADNASMPRRPSIDIAWAPEEADDAHGLLWEVRLSVEAEASLRGSHSDIDSGQLRIVAGLLPATSYRVRAQLILDRASAWTAWAPVTTPDIKITSADLDADLEEAIEDTLSAAALTEIARAAAQAAADLAVEAEIAARASEVGAAGAAGAAVISASHADAKADEAGEYAAEALDFRNTAARLMSGGVSKNPVFNDWPGTNPASVSVANLTAGTVSKITTGVRYSNAVEVNATNAAANGPRVYLDRVLNSLDCAISPRAVLARMEIEYISGDLEGSGSLFRGVWLEGVERINERHTKNLITATPGIVQTVEVYFTRPANAVPSAATNFRLEFWGHTGSPRPPLKVRIHRLDFEEVLAASETAIYQRAVADLAGIQSAVIGLRAVAGSSGALLELVAASDPTGSTSLARISADNILLEGTVRVEHMDVVWITGDRISASYLDVDSLLEIQPGAGLRYQKPSVAADSIDGIYFGADSEGRYGFATSRTAGGKRQSLKMASTTGLQILNARHFVTGETLPATTTITASAGLTNLPAGIRWISLDMVGGGGGGAAKRYNRGDTAPGGVGGTTIVRLYDGGTLMQTITAPGGAGGDGGGGTGSNGGAGEVSAHGPDYGSGGLGGAGSFSNTRWGQGGRASAAIVTDVIDVSGWATPRIEVVIGAGGIGAAVPSGWDPLSNPGQNGKPGRLVYTYSATRDTPADVLPLEPTAVGTFSKGNNVAGSFPDLGAGLWVLVADGNNNLRLDAITVAPGVTTSLSFVTAGWVLSAQTPTYAAAPNARTISYQFYSMGNWG